MKKKNLIPLAVIALCLVLFIGYRIAAQLKTDTTPPQITFSDETIRLSVQDPPSVLLQGISAADSHDGDVTDSVVLESIRMTDTDGSILVRYAAFDSAGNVTKSDRAAQYTDYESPRFSLTAPLLFASNSGFDVLDVIGAADTLDGNIRHRIRATSLDGTAVSTQGSHQVEFRVTNALGDTARLTLPVEVYPAGLYTMEVGLTRYLVYLERGSEFDAERYLDSVTRNRDTISLEDGTPRNYSVKIESTVNTRIPGVYTVDYTVTHATVNEYNPENTQVSTGRSRLIVVVEG